MTTGSKLGAGGALVLLILLLGLSFGGPGSGDGPAPEPEPEPEPQPGSKPRLYVHLQKGPHYYLSSQIDGGEPRTEVTRAQAVQAAGSFVVAGGDVWIVVRGDVPSGEWTAFQRALDEAKVPYFGGPPPVPPET